MRAGDWWRAGGSARARLTSLALLAAPAAVLGLLAAAHSSPMLAVGAVAELLGAMLFVRHRYVWRPPVSSSVILLYIMALAWLWFVTRQNPDGLDRVARGGLLFAAVALLLSHDLIRSGLEPRRRAGTWCRRLLARTRWPQAASNYADLPEVRALQDALRADPGPAFPLLENPRPEVRLAVLTALQARSYWRAGEAELVLVAVQKALDPAVRAAGVLALRSASDPALVLELAAFLRDRSSEVRRAALAALLMGHENRWPLIREQVRAALADPALAKDGSLTNSAGRLSPLAACDLTTWAAEPQPLAGRSTGTLVAHYAAELQHAEQAALPSELARQITDGQTPPMLRVELATLLRDLQLMTPDLLDRMTDIDQPGPIRVLAAETLLAWNPENPDAIDVLKGLGRQSNRETALVIARLLQTYLKLDMGLPPGEVPASGKLAGDVAKRVFTWATGRLGEPAPERARPRGHAGPPGLKQTALPPRNRGSSQETR